MTRPAKKLGTIHLVLAASLSAIFAGCAANAGEPQADEHAAIAPAAPAAQTESCIPRYDDPTSCLPKTTPPGPGSGTGEACYPEPDGSYGSNKWCIDVSQCVTQEGGHRSLAILRRLQRRLRVLGGPDVRRRQLQDGRQADAVIVRFAKRPSQTV